MHPNSLQFPVLFGRVETVTDRLPAPGGQHIAAPGNPSKTLMNAGSCSFSEIDIFLHKMEYSRATSSLLFQTILQGILHGSLLFRLPLFSFNKHIRKKQNERLYRETFF